MNEPSKPLLIAIVGSTASGKSSLAVHLAQQLGKVEIISADSRQIYRGMDIGTAKPPASDLAAIRHHLIDIKNPDEDYTVSDYQHDAIAAIDDVIARGATPVLVGGTGLYVKSVLENLALPKITSDLALRMQLEKEIAQDGLDAMFKKLVALDPEAAYIVDPKNPRRVIRALEVALITGEPFTQQRKKNQQLYSYLTIGISVEPTLLRERINVRIDHMMASGLIEEVRTLLERYGDTHSALEAIGYREIIAALQGAISFEEAIEAMKINTWHYAKRQMTWFKKDTSVQWIAKPEQTFELVERFLAAQ